VFYLAQQFKAWKGMRLEYFRKQVCLSDNSHKT